MAKNYVRRADDSRPSSGYRIPCEGGSLYLKPEELAGAAQIARAQQILGATQEEIAEAISEWVTERRQAQAFIRSK